MLLVVLALILVFGLLEGWFFQVQSDLPLSGNVFLISIINFNVLLLLLLAYLVLRNIVKLVFEHKRNILGHKLKTRLVIAFVGITLIPTIPLFWVAAKIIFSGLDHWFSQQMEKTLKESVMLAKDYLTLEERSLVLGAQRLKYEITQLDGGKDPELLRTADWPEVLASEHRIDSVFFYDNEGNLVWQKNFSQLPPVNFKLVYRVLQREGEFAPRFLILSRENRDSALISRIILTATEDPTKTIGQVVVMRRLTEPITAKLVAVATGYEDYLQLKLLHFPLKQSHFITFSIVTLLAIFAAVWFAFFLAKNLTGPIGSLVSAIQSVAEGDLDTQLQSDRQDEIGMLIMSFNKMVRDLKDSRKQLASAYQALQQSHEELEDRRRYMEIVLRNIGAGVVSVDAAGRLMTMNKSAEELFGFQAEALKGLHYSEFLQPPHVEIVKSFMSTHEANQQPNLEKQVQVMIGNRPMTLIIKASLLRDERGEYMGVVVVLDDISDLEKAQRMAAWREVARRIAHEIKNPLTPIQLSAQRLRRQYPALLTAEDSIFDESTRTIVQQVEHMKHLVNEFSKFARLPRSQPTPCDLGAIVEESLALYRHSSPHVAFNLVREGNLPFLKLDRDQFKQVMNNLLDNALHAIGQEPGEVTVRLTYDSTLKIARLECSDTGHGISDEDKVRMFEPYYSKKEKGTGLGLAIVASIIADHNGFIRVRNGDPCGTVMIIELPG